jgi:hypothetical protein
MTSPFCAIVALLLTAGSQSSATAPAAPDQARGLHRWIDFQAGTLETRYRYIESSAGETISNQLQHKQTLKGALKLDAGNRYTVQSFLGTGSGFTGSWDPTGAGSGKPTWDFRVRRLFLQAIPINGLELAAGSFDAIRGENTEITAFDNDAYLEGYRASVKRPASLYVDDLSVTIAFLGDLNEPNVFDRFHRMGDHNYSQLLASKRWRLASSGGRTKKDEVAISFDWSALEGVDTLRQAVRLTSAVLQVVDSVRFEQYWRVSNRNGYGFAIVAERTLHPRLTASGGFSHTDPLFLPLNGDRYGHGNRWLAEARLALRPELTLAAFYTNGFANDFPVDTNRRFDIVLSYNVLRALQQAHVW